MIFDLTPKINRFSLSIIKTLSCSFIFWCYSERLLMKGRKSCGGEWSMLWRRYCFLPSRRTEIILTDPRLQRGVCSKLFATTYMMQFQCHLLKIKYLHSNYRAFCVLVTFHSPKKRGRQLQTRGVGGWYWVGIMFVLCCHELTTNSPRTHHELITNSNIYLIRKGR
jgi:hypothetical protein